MPDIPDFVSPIDGKVVHGRAGLREHNKLHNVTNVADFQGQWERAAKERQRLFGGDTKYDSQRRKERLIHAYDTLMRKK